MKQSKWTIRSNQMIAERVYQMVLQGDTAGIMPGQFVDIEVPGKFLRRPISVCQCRDNELTIIYRVVGEGTAIMARMQDGEQLDILSQLGNGYDLSLAEENVLLVGGGVGVPPLMYAADCLSKMGKCVRVVMGFNSQSEVFGESSLRQMGCQVDVCTVDGSYGKKGLVTDYVSQTEPFYYACGPMPMLRALVGKIGTHGQVSMEERMGCGVGVCVGCSLETKQGVKRVCKEGPVFDAGAIIWK